MVTYNFSKFNARAKEGMDWFSKELSALRGGRAQQVILDSILVESYGSKMPIRNIASISVEDPKTLRIVPFDTTVTKEIEKAITIANLGLSVSSDDGGVRVHFPDLTSERRQALLKVGKEKLENARVTLRKLRDETMKDLEQKEKEGEIGEDEKFRLKKELEKLVDAENKKLQDAFERKEKEIAS